MTNTIMRRPEGLPGGVGWLVGSFGRLGQRESDHNRPHAVLGAKATLLLSLLSYRMHTVVLTGVMFPCDVFFTILLFCSFLG